MILEITTFEPQIFPYKKADLDFKVGRLPAIRSPKSQIPLFLFPQYTRTSSTLGIASTFFTREKCFEAVSAFQYVCTFSP